MKLCLHSSYNMQNSFRFDDFFLFFMHYKSRILLLKKFVKLCLHSSKCKTPFILTNFYDHEKKIRETLFTFKLHRIPLILANFYDYEKNSWNFVYILAKQCRYHFNLTNFFHKKQKIANFYLGKKFWKKFVKFVYIQGK